MAAEGRIGRPVLRDVVLGADRPVDVFQRRIRPRLREVRRGRRHRRQRRTGQRDRAAALVDALLLVAEIGFHAQVVALVVQAQREQALLTAFIVDGRIATARHRVHANAKLLLVAEAAAHVEMAAGLAVAGVVEGALGDRRRRGVLGHQVYRAAHRGAGGRYTGQEGVGAAEHFHAFQAFGRGQLARGDAEQAVVAQIVRTQREAAHHEGFGKVAEARTDADGRIVGQHLAHRVGLLVLDLIGRVRRDAERHVHEVLVAQQADAGAACHLAAGIRRGQLVRRALALDGHGGQRLLRGRGGLLREGQRRQHAGGGQRGGQETQPRGTR